MFGVGDVRFFKGSEWPTGIISRAPDIYALNEDLNELRKKICSVDIDTLEVADIVFRSLQIFLGNWIFAKEITESMSPDVKEFSVACEAVFESLVKLLLVMRQSKYNKLAQLSEQTLVQGEVYCVTNAPGPGRGIIHGNKRWEDVYTTWSKDSQKLIVASELPPSGTPMEISCVISGSDFGISLDALGVKGSDGAVVFKAKSSDCKKYIGGHMV